jgi:hypothetical protein
MTDVMTVAGRKIEAPLEVTRDYADKYWRTLKEYDLEESDCGPDEVSEREVQRTRVIASRISRWQAAEMRRILGRGRLAAIPTAAMLQDADPSENGGLYDEMQRLYSDLETVEGVASAKISKLLHLKRPRLFPILDSKLMRLYRRAAAEAAQRYPQRGFRRMWWAAVRDDVIANQELLKPLRSELAHEAGLLGQTAGLSDVRLLDIAAWKL